MSSPLTPLEPWIAAKIGQGSGPLDHRALHAHQLARLNDTLTRVRKRSRFYGRLLGSHETQLESLDELARLPFTTADDLRAEPLDLLCVPQHEIDRIVTLPTSGTTGTPKRIFFTAQDQELTRDFFHVGMSTLVEPGERVLILLPGELPGSVGALLMEGLARMQVEGIAHGPVSDPRHTLKVMETERATSLVGIPIQVLSLVKSATADGTPAPSALKSALLSTDRLPHAVARIIEKTWGCDVYDHYGATEMGLGGGVDCARRVGYHLREADLLFEIVDPVTGDPVPDGEDGEVVFSTLTRTAMPLIRYRTGDMSRFIPEPCPCGTTLRRMAHIDHRVSGPVHLPAGHALTQGDFDEALLPLEGVTDFRVSFDEDQGQGRIVVHLRLSEGASESIEAEVRRSLEAIPALAAEMASGTVSVELSDWEHRGQVSSGTAKRTIARTVEVTG